MCTVLVEMFGSKLSVAELIHPTQDTQVQHFVTVQFESRFAKLIPGKVSIKETLRRCNKAQIYLQVYSADIFVVPHFLTAMKYACIIRSFA